VIMILVGFLMGAFSFANMAGGRPGRGGGGGDELRQGALRRR